MKIFTAPTVEMAQRQTTNAINQIVLRLTPLLAQRGIDTTDRIEEADLFVGHAGLRGKTRFPDVAVVHGLTKTILLTRGIINSATKTLMTFPLHLTEPSNWSAKMATLDSTLFLICTKCRLEKPVTEFSKNKSRKTGYCAHCKSCAAIKQALYLEKNRDNAEFKARRTEIERRYRQKRKDDSEYKTYRIERQRAYVQRNREAVNQRDRERNERPERQQQRKANMRNWYEANREHIRNYHRNYRRLKPEMRRAQTERRRSLKRNAEGNFSAQDITTKYEQQSGRCYWCHKELNEKYHIDHYIPLSRGGTNYPSNIVIACVRCNTTRQDKLPSEWTPE
jgi:hypothetical protein